LRTLLLILFPCLLSAQVAVIDRGDVEINSKTYKQAKLTYTFDRQIEMTGFIIAKLEKEVDKAVRLRVDYKDKGANKSQTFLGKMPKIKKLKDEKVSAVPIAEKEKGTKK
jgi:hypothetical protein